MPQVEQTRGPVVESVHPFSVAVVRDGALVEMVGDDRRTAMRSAAKPFQLASSLEALGNPELPEDELALGTASHSGEPVHLAIVTRILERFGLTVDGLRCGAHPPMHEASARAVLRAGGDFTALHNNCSGKHAFMLAATTRSAWDLDYRPEAHPLQRLIRARFEGFSGVVTDVAIDGCGVPTFIVPLSAAARAWGRVASAMRSVEEGKAQPEPDARIGRIGWAIAHRPELTSGTGRLDLDIVRSAREPIAAKIGAAGLFCIALPHRGIGLAIKVASGSSEALPAAVAWALQHAAPTAFLEPEHWRLREVRNVVGAVVGGFAVAG